MSDSEVELGRGSIGFSTGSSTQFFSTFGLWATEETGSELHVRALQGILFKKNPSGTLRASVRIVFLSRQLIELDRHIHRRSVAVVVCFYVWRDTRLAKTRVHGLIVLIAGFGAISRRIRQWKSTGRGENRE